MGTVLKQASVKFQKCDTFFLFAENVILVFRNRSGDSVSAFIGITGLSLVKERSYFLASFCRGPRHSVPTRGEKSGEGRSLSPRHKKNSARSVRVTGSRPPTWSSFRGETVRGKLFLVQVVMQTVEPGVKSRSASLTGMQTHWGTSSRHAWEK